MIPDDLVALTKRAARLWPDKTAWLFDETGTTLTFGDIDRETDRLAGSLHALGIRPGDRVAVMLRNEPAFPLLWLALAKLGAVLVPVNTNYRELDGAHVIRHSGARLAIAAPEFTDLLTRIGIDVHTPDALPAGAPPEHRPAAEAPTNIQYTSGTTGAPKGCVLPHRYWTTLARSLVDDFPHLTDEDTILTAQPFHYIDPQWNVAAGLAAGATLVVLDRFHPKTFWPKVREHGVTWFYCLGLMPALLLRQPAHPDDERHRVRSVMASAIPRDLHADLEARWGVPWYEAFGMTETGGDIRDRPEDHRPGSGCIGRPIREREAMIADEEGKPVPRGSAGELLIRGVGLMHGYHDDPEATAHAFRDGWFHTGDLATMDAAGRIHYVGRTKDMIRRSGENISADEVERALLQHPAVELAAVIAVPDDLRGEEVKAFIVPAADTTPDELAEFCATQLAYFKVPRYWSLTADLPRTPSERIAKGKLAALDTPTYDRVAQTWL
ncbi:ATP-dependent acyl-CoA ligase [Amycolatopsis deserti]|nr:ATP-dependent acyl-CoA ligase [Amycolatopsis deserti]